MLKMAISCGMGMSSSAVTQHMKKEIIKDGLQDQVSVDYIPFPLLMEQQDDVDFDIILLCPHLMFYSKNAVKDKFVKIPMYIIPAKMYGTMSLQYLMEDAIDLLAENKEKQEMLLHFPEEKLLDIKRSISHRRWILKHPIAKP